MRRSGDMVSGLDSVEERDDDKDEEDETAQRNKVERDRKTNKIVAVHVHNDDCRPCIVRRYSTIMLQADPGVDKFIGYVRDILEEPADIKVDVCWFYRASDMPKERHNMITRKARLHGYPGGGDKGRFKEIYVSNHTDTISCESIMHAVKVWFLPNDSITPLLVQPAAAASASSSQPPTGREALLPGFVCRRFIDVKKVRVLPLSKVSMQSKELGKWLLKDVAELMRLSQEERKVFMAEWRRRCSERMAKAAGQLGSAGGDDAMGRDAE